MRMLKKLKWHVVIKFGAVICMMCLLLWTWSTSYSRHQEAKTKPLNIRLTMTTPTTASRVYRVCTMLSGGGRLGNMMFQYAAVFGISITQHMQPMISMDNDVYNSFYVTAERFRTSDQCSPPVFKSYNEHACCVLENLSLNTETVSNIKLDGYRQSWKYFHPYEDKIRSEFTFKKEKSTDSALTIRREIKNQLGWEYLPNSSAVTLVGVHVRRGDIPTNPILIKHGFLTAPRAYFYRAMNEFRANYTDIVFIVCSDDHTWSHANLNGKDIVHMPAEHPGFIDMAILVSCDHTIMSVGTFGWWSGFLAGGTVIYYGKPAKDGSVYRYQFGKDMLEYYYPIWIRLE